MNYMEIAQLHMRNNPLQFVQWFFTIGVIIP